MIISDHKKLQQVLLENIKTIVLFLTPEYEMIPALEKIFDDDRVIVFDVTPQTQTLVGVTCVPQMRLYEKEKIVKKLTGDEVLEWEDKFFTKPVVYKSQKERDSVWISKIGESLLKGKKCQKRKTKQNPKKKKKSRKS